MKRYRDIFFDLDHTLWDFDKNSELTLFEIFEKFELLNHLNCQFDDFLMIYKVHNKKLWDDYAVGKIEKSVLRYLRFEQTLSAFSYFDKELAETIGNYYVAHSPHKTHLFPDALPVLEYLTQKQYKLHIITNGFEEVQHIKLDKSGLKPFFIDVITSEEAGAKKPSELVFNYALNKTSASIETSLMIGDSYESDIIGAKNIGMDQVYFCPLSQWAGGGATYKISSLKELRQML